MEISEPVTQAVISVRQGRKATDLVFTSRAECRALIAAIAGAATQLPDDGQPVTLLQRAAEQARCPEVFRDGTRRFQCVKFAGHDPDVPEAERVHDDFGGWQWQGRDPAQGAMNAASEVEAERASGQAPQLERTNGRILLAVCGRHWAMDAFGRCAHCEEVAAPPEPGPEPVPPCWCGHVDRVHNVVSGGGGRGFCTECSPGRCGRYEAAKPPEPVITDVERDCGELNPDGGWPCHRSGGHLEHRDGNGDTWTTAAARPEWCAFRADDGRACARPAHPDDEQHAGADGMVIELEPARSWQDDMAGRPALTLVTRPDYEVIPELQKPCNEAHPSKGTLCTGKIPHPMPHADEDGDTWATEPLAVSS